HISLVAAKGDRLREHAFIGHGVPRRFEARAAGTIIHTVVRTGRNENGPRGGPRIEALTEERVAPAGQSGHRCSTALEVWSRSEKSMVLSSRGLKMTLPRISGAAITRQSQATNSGSRDSWCGPSLPHQPAKVSLRLRAVMAAPACLCRANQVGRAAARR